MLKYNDKKVKWNLSYANLVQIYFGRKREVTAQRDDGKVEILGMCLSCGFEDIPGMCLSLGLRTYLECV